MSLFKDQYIFCPNCGEQFWGKPPDYSGNGSKTCSKDCRERLDKKYTAYVMGINYKPG